MRNKKLKNENLHLYINYTGGPPTPGCRLYEALKWSGHPYCTTNWCDLFKSDRAVYENAASALGIEVDCDEQE